MLAWQWENEHLVWMRVKFSMLISKLINFVPTFEGFDTVFVDGDEHDTIHWRTKSLFYKWCSRPTIPRYKYATGNVQNETPAFDNQSTRQTLMNQCSNIAAEQ